MRLHTLTLSNFQGTKSLSMNFEGLSASVYGANGVGKTTLANAVCWLLTGKDSENTKGYTPKTNDDVGGEVHNLEHTAEAVFVMESGERITLKKVFREIWKKKRGRATSEFSGNTTDYYINGVVQKEKEYSQFILNTMGGEEHLKMLTMPRYFVSDLDWKKRRALLSEIFGNITDDEVIAGYPEELDALRSFLTIPGTADQRYSVEEYKKIATSQKRDLNRRLDMLPALIDEATRAIPVGVDSLEEDDIRKEMAEVNEHLSRLRTQQQNVTIDVVAQQLSDATMSARSALAQARLDHMEGENNRLSGKRNEAAQLQQQLFSRRASLGTLDSEIRQYQFENEQIKAKREKLLKEWNDVYAEKWDVASETCPTCGQKLPAEKVEQLRGDFNQRKSNRLAAITKEGQTCSATVLSETQAKIDDLMERRTSCNAEIQAEQAKLEELQASIVVTPFENTELFAKLNKRIEECVQAEANHRSNASPHQNNADLSRRIDEWTQRFETLNRQLGDISTATNQRARIKQLEQEEKTVSAEYERVEQGVYLCEEFIRCQTKMVDEMINHQFKTIRFKLFEEQVDGGLRECCEVLIPSDAGAMVPYSSANAAAKINAGLEVIDVLGEHFGVSVPVLLDGGESVSHPLKIKAQVIRFVVSDNDKQLRLEIKNE